MRETARGRFQVTGWDERTYEELPRGGKLSEAKVTQRFDGDIAGEGSVVWLMCYPSPNAAEFVGLQRVVAMIDGRSGSFVMRTEGTFDGQMARWSATVVPGSGSDGLSGLRGVGTFEAPHGSTATYTIDYELEQ